MFEKHSNVLYIVMKNGSKTAPSSLGAAPGASTLWRLKVPPPCSGSQKLLQEAAPKSSSHKVAPGAQKRLPRSPAIIWHTGWFPVLGNV